MPLKDLKLNPETCSVAYGGREARKVSKSDFALLSVLNTTTKRLSPEELIAKLVSFGYKWTPHDLVSRIAIVRKGILTKLGIQAHLSNVKYEGYMLEEFAEGQNSRPIPTPPIRSIEYYEKFYDGLRAGGCGHIIGHPGDDGLRYCGKPVVGKRTYCLEHMILLYQNWKTTPEGVAAITADAARREALAELEIPAEESEEG